MYSFVFKNSTLVDGAGAPTRIADVAVHGDRIAVVAAGIDEPAEARIDASGLVLAPGFIDIHSHTDATIFRHPFAESKVFQGVTTEVTGNCGLGVFPVASGREEELAGLLGLHEFFLPDGFRWHDFESYAEKVERLAPAINLAPLVGHAPLRIAAMGMEDRRPTQPELERMQALLKTALRQGAWGMSTGLIYPPGSYAASEELKAIAGTLAACGGLYATHIRSESDRLFDALGEAIDIGRSADVRVQISHLKALGGKNRGKAGDILAAISAARSQGIEIGADQYPYAASATSLSATVPSWAHEGGTEALLRRLKDPELSSRIAVEIGREMAQREGASRISVSCSAGLNNGLSGKTLTHVAEIWRCRPEQAVIRLLVEEKGRVGAIFFSMAEEDVETILADPQVAVGSDGHGMRAEDLEGEATHPRSYGTFPRVLGKYVREKKLLALPAAVRKMTALPAARLGLSDRGLVRPGFAADLILFDPATIKDISDYSDPHRYSTGIVHLLVNGQPVIRDGRLTGLRPGRVLRKHAGVTGG